MTESLSKLQKHVHVPEEKRATEYLANERTFLAWIRTSIAVIGAGFVISRFAVWVHESAAGQPQTPPPPPQSIIVGVAIMALGAVLALLAPFGVITSSTGALSRAR